jgi:imidazole glycerol-phosphate synthase subunit HisH
MIAIIDYGAGNLASVQWALEKLGLDTLVTSKAEDILTADKVIFPGVGAAGQAMAELKRRNLLGVIREVVASGKSFLGICLGMQILFERSEEDGGVECLGILKGKVKSLKCKAQSLGREFKIPHMGWNQVNIVQSSLIEGESSPVIPAEAGIQKTKNDRFRLKGRNDNDGISPSMLVGQTRRSAPMGTTIRVSNPSGIWDGMPNQSWFYFVHSYFVETSDKKMVAGETDYGGLFTSAVQRGSLVAVQFHPEKSGETGLRFLRNFCEPEGTC